MTYAPAHRIASRFLRNGDGEVVSANERNILRLIWHHPGLSRSAVTGRIDLTQQSVHRIIDQLAERGFISLGAPVPGHGRGQPSPTLRLNGANAYSVGLSVNTDIIGISIVDLSGHVLGSGAIPLIGQSMEEALAEVRACVGALRAKHRLGDGAFFGIGFAISGYHVGGTRYNAPLPLHEWSLIELGPLLADFFDRPVWVHNGANTGAIAEAMFGVGRHIRHFAYLSFNYGFGGGLISDGELLLGGNGNAGEFSGMYDHEESQHRPALQFLIARLRQNGVEVPSISHMRQHFDPAWPGVDAWIDEVTPAYNRLVNAIWAVFDPQAIVFGGQVPHAIADRLIERTELFGRPRYGVPHPSPKLVISDLEGDASALGAAIVPFKTMLL